MKLIIFLVFFFAEVVLEAGAGLQSVIFTGLSLKNLLLIGLLVAVFYKKNKVRKLVYLPAINKLVSIFSFFTLYALLITIMASSFFVSWNYDTVTALISWKGIVLDGICGLLVYALLVQGEYRSKQLIIYMVYVLAFMGLLTMTEAILHVPQLFGVDDNSIRPNGPMGEPNQSAVIYAMLVPLCFSFIFTQRRPWIFIICLGVVLTTILLTGSRGGMLSAALAMIVFLGFGQRYINVSNKIKMLLMAPVVLMAAWFVVPAEMIEQLVGRIFAYQDKGADIDELSAGRTYLWRLAYDIWIQSPILGSGWDSFKMYYHMATHNTLLQILTDLGVFGFGLYILLIYRLLYVPWRLFKHAKNKNQKLMFLGIFCSFLALFFAVFFVNLYKSWLVAWMLIGACLGYSNSWYQALLAEAKNKR